MRREIKDFLLSDNMVVKVRRDKSKDIISQWTTCRSILRPPLNCILANIAKLLPTSKMTSAFYRAFLGMKIGNKVGFAQIEPDYLLPEAIEIGDNSAIGWQTKLMTHEFTQDSQRYGKIKIGKNVVIGAFSIIRGGVRIGDNSIVAMASFVNKDIPSDEVWGGVPAQRLRKLGIIS